MSHWLLIRAQAKSENGLKGENSPLGKTLLPLATKGPDTYVHKEDNP